MHAALLALLTLGVQPVHGDDLAGHGGPVSALAMAGDAVLSGSFDTRAIRWSLQRSAADRVLHVHEGNVSAVAFAPDGTAVTAGQDGRVAIWAAEGDAAPVLHPLHEAPVAALSIGPDGSIASAGWDGRIGGISADGQAYHHEAHQSQVTGVAHLEDGRIVSVGGDLRLRIWDGTDPAGGLDLPAQPNGLARGNAGLAVIFADGALRILDPDEGILRERFLAERPLIAVAAAAGRIAVAGIDGTVWLLDEAGTSPPTMLDAGQGPVWALALSAQELLTGGADGRIRRWSAADGRPLGTGATRAQAQPEDGSRGAEVWRACAACHTVGPDDQNRAGPTLHAIFGRRAGTAPGYAYSSALRTLDLVWTPETVSALFEHGPASFTPGSRMPDQRIADPADRAALMEYLARVTR
ncbi:c-type cytochrome [Plastorhodobacter daqingensis]|uniref:C-type cytochrome n=1 Tax=Plastorhodobacter daqingensis TaxID=1387281 RepID=A0ABW2UPM2_9RHOB